MRINLQIGLIAQEIQEFLPEIVHQSYGQINNINTEFSVNDIKIYNNKVTLQLNDLDVQEGNKIEICDISEDGLTSNIRTVGVTIISGKHVDNFNTIDYQALIPIVKNFKNDKIKILKDKINILESNKN